MPTPQVPEQTSSKTRAVTYRVVLAITIAAVIAIGGFFSVRHYAAGDKQPEATNTAFPPFSGREFNEGGIRFAIPPHIFHALQSAPESSALDYSFYTEGNMVSDTSSIGLTIQVKQDGEPDPYVFAEDPPGTVKKMINWGNLQGNRYVDAAVGEPRIGAWQGSSITEIYPVPFSSQPVILTYRHSIHDDTLETLWATIHNEVEMDLASNLGSYQTAVHASARALRDATNWKTEVKSAYGLSFKYPRDWEVVALKKQGIGFRPSALLPKGNAWAAVSVYIRQNPKKLDVESFYKQGAASSNFYKLANGVESVTKNGVTMTYFGIIPGPITESVAVRDFGTYFAEVHMDRDDYSLVSNLDGTFFTIATEITAVK